MFFLPRVLTEVPVNGRANNRGSTVQKRFIGRKCDFNQIIFYMRTFIICLYQSFFPLQKSVIDLTFNLYYSHFQQKIKDLNGVDGL